MLCDIKGRGDGTRFMSKVEYEFTRLILLTLGSTAMLKLLMLKVSISTIYQSPAPNVSAVQRFHCIPTASIQM